MLRDDGRKTLKALVFCKQTIILLWEQKAYSKVAVTIRRCHLEPQQRCWKGIHQHYWSNWNRAKCVCAFRKPAVNLCSVSLVSASQHAWGPFYISCWINLWLFFTKNHLLLPFLSASPSAISYYIKSRHTARDWTLEASCFLPT